MSAWVPSSGASSSAPSGATGTTRQFYATGGGGTSNAASVYHPTPTGGGSGIGAQPAVATPGVVSINPLDPAGSISGASDPITGLLNGLKDNLFGTSLPDKSGQHGGLLGDVPGVGAGLRAGSEAIANAGGAVAGAGSGLVGHAQDALGGLLERTPIPGPEEMLLKEQFAKPEIQQWLDEKNTADPTKTNREAYASDTVLGLSNEAHMQSAAIRQFAKDQQVKNPNGFNPGAWTVPGSLADLTTLVLDDGFGTLGGGAQRALGGLQNIQGQDRLGRAQQAVYADRQGVKNDASFLSLEAGKSTPVEQLAVMKFDSGEWTRDQALDFLASSGTSMFRNPMVQAAASMIVDPLNLATFGAAGVAKAGLKGAETLATVSRAEEVLTQAAEALRVAQEAADGAKTARAVKTAAKGLDAAQTAFDEAKAARESLDVYHATNTPRGLNALANAAEGSGNVQKMLLSVGRGYSGLEGTMLGRSAKLTRTLIDPLHALDLHMPGAARNVDLLSDSLTKSLSNVMGDKHYLGNINHMKGLDATGGVLDQYARDLATAMANRGREGLLQMHQAAAVMQGVGGKLAGGEGALLRDQAIEAAEQSVKEKDLLKWLRYDITSNVIQHDWNDAAHANLAKALESSYHIPAEDWLQVLPTMSKEQKSLLKLANYGRANSRLIDAVTNSAGHASAAEFPLRRVVLLSKSTLTRVGGDSLLAQLKVAKTRKAVNIVRQWQADYPELRYISIDPANPGKSIQRMVNYLEDHLDAMPMQVKEDELGKMTDEMQALGKDLAGDGGYTLGFRPNDEYLWGIERANEAGGEYIGKRTPWADHVGEGGLGYRPGRELPLNIAGMPIIGGPLRAATKAVDYMEAGARQLGGQVSGAQIAEVARKKFVSEELRGAFAEHGLTEEVAQKWWDRIQEYTREHQGYSGPRGFGKGELYNAISQEKLIPQTLLNGSMRLTEQDILGMVLKAYDGDMRFIGLTQKLSGRAKLLLSQATGFDSNFTGQIAEHAWPTLKFRYNPIFQLQEKVEPWVLNAQRGVSFATGVKLSEADAATERLLQRMTDNSLIRQADLDQAEYSAQVLLGKRLGVTAATPASRMGQMAAKANSIMDVQGVKRINMLRTFRQGLGREVRAAWDEAMPGVWDDMKLNANAKAGRVLDDDEFALQMMGENLFANDIKVMASGKTGALKADWANAIKPGAWHVPSHIGELQSLDLDHVAASMNTIGVKGKTIQNLKDLRAYVAEDNRRVGEVSDFLRRMGADKDYVARVENALTFSWEGFWREAGRRFNLTADESKSLQDMVGESAKLRGLSPVDYLSQVYHPGILDGTEGIVGSLDKPLGVLRRSKTTGEVLGKRGRSRLAGVEGTSTREDLVHQLSDVFAQHLDPSAKRALLMEFRPELRAAVKNGSVRLHMDDIKAMWDADAEGQLADRILGYMDGRPGTGTFDTITDESRGSKAVRDGADRYLAKNGVTPDPERRHYQVDDAHYQQVADEYGALPTVDYERTGRRPMTKSVYAADTDLKPKPDGVDDRTYEAYQQFVHETKAQWDHMTAPKSAGGMGIKVTVAKGEPYTADAAGRAAMQKDIAKGQLRVYGLESDHPLMTNEQNVMFRAVHDVFGHAANDFAFGPRGELNAAATHFKMYGTEARGPLLTETHGQTAYVNYSKDTYDPFGGAGAKADYQPPAELDPEDPVASFEDMHHFAVPEGQQGERPSIEQTLADPDYPPELKEQLRSAYPTDPNTGYVEVDNAAGDQRGFMHYNQFVGDGIRGLPKSQQYAILQPLSDLLNEFPDMRVHHIDVVDLGGSELVLDPNNPNKVLRYGLGDNVNGVAFGSDEDEAVILLSDRNFGMDFEDAQQALYDSNENFKSYRVTTKAKIDPATGRQQVVNGVKQWDVVPRSSAPGVGHNFDPGVEGLVRHEAGHALDLMLRPRRPGQGHIMLTQHREYASVVSQLQNDTEARKWLSEYGMTDSKEFAAELFSAATDPNLELTDLPEKLQPMVQRYQDVLRSEGYWKPQYVPDPEALAQQGKTVAEVNAAKRGTVYAPQKAALLPQSTIDDFAKQFVGVGKHVESNPDVARVAQQFGKWSSGAVANGLLKGDKAVHADLLNDIAGIPTHSATPYNLTEGLAAQLATQTMANKWEDAFRLQYFAQSRSMLERSINHPMFGLYPASYMWGKLMPEVVQFLAQRPLGIRTGGALYSAMDMQRSIALQREYNPEMDKMLEGLGHSQAMSFAGYLLPTLPWDISASAPIWMKDVAGQGLRNEQNIAAGKPVEGFNVTQPLTDVAKKLNPMETNIPWAGRAIEEVNGPNSPTEKQSALRQAIASKGPIKAADMTPELSAVMAELREALVH